MLACRHRLLDSKVIRHITHVNPNGYWINQYYRTDMRRDCWCTHKVSGKNGTVGICGYNELLLVGWPSVVLQNLIDLANHRLTFERGRRDSEANSHDLDSKDSDLLIWSSCVLCNEVSEEVSVGH